VVKAGGKKRGHVYVCTCIWDMCILCIYVYVYKQVSHVNMYRHLYTHIYVMYICVYKCLYIFMYICVFYVYMFMYIFMYICVCIYVYTNVCTYLRNILVRGSSVIKAGGKSEDF